MWARLSFHDRVAGFRDSRPLVVHRINHNTTGCSLGWTQTLWGRRTTTSSCSSSSSFPSSSSTARRAGTEGSLSVQTASFTCKYPPPFAVLDCSGEGFSSYLKEQVHGGRCQSRVGPQKSGTNFCKRKNKKSQQLHASLGDRTNS